MENCRNTKADKKIGRQIKSVNLQNTRCRFTKKAGVAFSNIHIISRKGKEYNE